MFIQILFSTVMSEKSSLQNFSYDHDNPLATCNDFNNKFLHFPENSLTDSHIHYDLLYHLIEISNHFTENGFQTFFDLPSFFQR